MATSGNWSIQWNSGNWGTYPKAYKWWGNWTKSGNTITLSSQQLQIVLLNGATGWGTWNDTVRTTGGADQVITDSFPGGTSYSTPVSLNNSSFTVGSADTSATIQCIIADEQTGSTTITFDASDVGPTGLTFSNISATKDRISANVSVSSWGTGGSMADRYLELNASPTGSPDARRFQKSYAPTGSQKYITITNSSEVLGGVNLTPNTLYYLWAYASNGSQSSSTSSTGTNIVTKPGVVSVSVNTTSETSVSLAWSVGADGGYYQKNLEYSVNDGAWTAFATNLDGTSHSGIYTINGLDGGTTYTIRTRAKSMAGNTTGQEITITTLAVGKMYGSVDELTKKIVNGYGSVNDMSKKIVKVYGSVSGLTKRIY